MRRADRLLGSVVEIVTEPRSHLAFKLDRSNQVPAMDANSPNPAVRGSCPRNVGFHIAGIDEFAAAVVRPLATNQNTDSFDFLVNNARNHAPAPFGEITEADFDRVSNIHFDDGGPLKC